MASDIKTSHLCCLSAALVFDTTSPSAKACAAGTGSVGRSSEPQLASLRHGRLTPARISPGCPPCLRLGLGRSIIVPDGVIAIQLAIGCFVDGWTRLAPYLAVIDRCRSAWLSKPNRKVWVSSFATLRCASTGGLGASSSVACPCSEGPVRKVFRRSDIRFSKHTEGKGPLTA